MSDQVPREWVLERFDYHKDGYLTWKINKARFKKGDKLNGYLTSYGYLYTSVKCKRFFMHRLIWLYHNENIPRVLDHINCIKTDNRIENLREATHFYNEANKLKRKGTSSKYKGVQFKYNRWHAACCQTYLGSFATEEDAAMAYDKEATKVFGEFARLNIEKEVLGG